jgi:1,2-diacylglycerol 3-alpha-glucosyltransferase
MKKKLNIAFFLDNFYPQVNGVVTSSLNTAFELSRRGHSIFGIVPCSGKNENYSEKYFPFQTLFCNGFFAYFYPDFIFTYPFSNSILNSMKNFKPDIIHFHAPFTIGYQAIRTSKKLNVPVIGTFHTFFAEPEYLSIVGLENSKFLNSFGWWYSNNFFNRCDAVVSPGNATADILSNRDLKNELHVISNGVEVSKYSKYKFNPEKFPVKIDDKTDWIIYIGRISKEKCIDVLLDSFKIVSDNIKNVKLLIVGDGPYTEDFKKLIKKYKLTDKIILSGMVQNIDLLESGVISKMKCFVTASTSENQPMTILESIMFGLPIVGVDAKGIPELIEDNGFLVKPGDHNDMADKIILILKDKKLHAKFSKRSLELAAKYDIQNTTDKMEELYYSEINKRGILK